VPQRVKRDRLGLYLTLCECGECGCNYECGYEIRCIIWIGL